MPTIPYLHFQGQCAEALAFYADVFASPAPQLMRYGDGPGAADAWKGSPRVMHGEVTIGGAKLMASDYPPGMEGAPQAGFSVMQSAPDVQTARRYFDRLADGGAVLDDLKATFFSPGFGMVKDRFGTHWIVSTVPAA